MRATGFDQTVVQQIVDGMTCLDGERSRHMKFVERQRGILALPLFSVSSRLIICLSSSVNNVPPGSGSESRALPRSAENAPAKAGPHSLWSVTACFLLQASIPLRARFSHWQKRLSHIHWQHLIQEQGGTVPKHMSAKPVFLHCYAYPICSGDMAL